MAKNTTANGLDFGSARINELAGQFADTPELPWMMASAAVLETHKIISARVAEVLTKFDLTSSRFEIIGLLDRAPEGVMTARDLKVLTFIQPPTMTYTLDWLEERDLVSRRASSADRRSVDVAIMKKGRALFADASAALAEIHFGLTGIGAGDAIAAARALGRLHPDA